MVLQESSKLTSPKSMDIEYVLWLISYASALHKSGSPGRAAKILKLASTNVAFARGGIADIFFLA